MKSLWLPCNSEYPSETFVCVCVCVWRWLPHAGLMSVTACLAFYWVFLPTDILNRGILISTWNNGKKKTSLQKEKQERLIRVMGEEGKQVGVGCRGGGHSQRQWTCPCHPSRPTVFWDEARTFMGERCVWGAYPCTPSMGARLLLLRCISSLLFPGARWAGLCSSGGVSSSWYLYFCRESNRVPRESTRRW